MRGLHIEPMTKTARGGGGSTRITVDTREFNMAMRNAEKVIADAMFEGSGRAFEQTKRETDRYLRSLTFQTPQAKKVANSLDYTKGAERRQAIQMRGDEISLEARFGSRGPHIRGEIGVGVHTSPDDNQGTFNIGQAVEEGINPRTFSFKAEGASQHGRQIGRAKGPTAWYGKGGTAEFRGIKGTEYISHASNFFNRRIKQEVERRLEF